MSKGIGSNYVNRMKRYHVPNIRNPSTRISVICDRAFYHDGPFRYKLPRFYRDRLYRKKFPCDAKVWNVKLKCYENKIVYRYKSKNILALQMSLEVRNRLLREYDRRVAELSAQYPSYSRSEIDILLSRSDSFLKVDRYKSTSAKMSRFYNFNRNKNSKL